MKILFYGLNFAPELTGIGKYSGEMAAWLAQHGHQVQVVCANPYYPEWRVHAGFAGWRSQQGPAAQGGGALHITRCPLWVPAQPSGAKRLLHLLSFALTSLPALVRGLWCRPDLVFVVAPALLVAPQALLLARAFGVPAWLHVQDFEVDAALGLGLVRGGLLAHWARRFESMLLSRFAAVSSISGAMCARLSAKGVAPQRVVMLPNWVDLVLITPLSGANGVRADLGIGSETTLLLYAGNMGEKQGLDVVIDAARRLTGESGLLFLMVGTGAALGRLQTAAQGLRNMVWWPLQPLQRFNELLNAADIHLLPQRGDAADLVMPSKLGGMLASGRAVIGTAAADTELGRVLDAIGVRIDTDQPALLADAIRRLAADPQQRAALGAAGRRLAEQTLDIGPVMHCFIRAAIALRRRAAPPPDR